MKWWKWALAAAAAAGAVSTIIYYNPSTNSFSLGAPTIPPPIVSATGKNLGIWTQVVDWGMAGDTFAQNILSEPAQFKSIEAVINENFDQEIAAVSAAASVLDGTKVKIEVECVLDPTMSFGVPQWNAMANTLAPHSSIVSIGVNGERSPNITNDNYAALYATVTALGKQMINYYVPSNITLPAGALQLKHTNFPYQDPLSSVSGGQSQGFLGMDLGYYATYMNPLWTQTVLNQILQIRGSIALPYSTYCNLAYASPFDPAFNAMIAGSPYRNLFG